MKLQRSRLRMISLVLLFAFLFAVLVCIRHTGLLQTEEGDSPAAEESLPLTESDPEAGPDFATPAPANDFDTFGL